ncbi:S-layer homology domain-containing protein [Paenibacillus sp. V4I7]|uniref:S-layer homology domain-containing protein n=1 Tax=Paenibacillus sp. V4I7 TaxID=3042307 RepID=UPI0027D80A56|nr:S-layer homology domain-containing protein [Paenibacillus sp. V4I7]
MMKTSQVLFLAMLLMVFMPVIAFASSGFSGVTFDGKNVSATVYGETYSPKGVAVHVYGPDGYVTSTTATYSTYNVTDSVYVYTLTDFNVTGNVYNTVTLKAPDVTTSVYTATYTAPVVVTPTVDTTSPDWTGAVLSATPGETSVVLSWPIATDTSTVTYYVYNGTLSVETVTGTTYTVNGLTAGTSYTFEVKAVDANGNWSTTVLTKTVSTTSTPVVPVPVVDTTPPDWTDAVLSATPSETSVVLSWPAAIDTSTVIYFIYNGTLPAGTVTSTTYTVNGLTAGTSYTFMVKAIDVKGYWSTTELSKTVSTTATETDKDTSPSNPGGTKANGPSNEIEITVGSPVAKEALEKAFAGNDNVTIKLKGDSASLSASGLIEAAKKAGTSVTITSENGTYVLPLSLLKLDDLAKSLGIAVADLNIKVSITKVSGTTATAVSDGVKAIGATSLTDAIDFKVTAEGKDGKSVEINGFGNSYVSRSVTIGKAVDMKKVTGVLYNEVTKKFSFVPATFETKDGKTVATLKRNGNSIYTVVEINKNFTDIASHWSKDDVSLLANKLVIDGATDTTFAPDRNITRAEFAALVVRSLGLNTDATSTTFTDVKSSDWYAGAVAAAVGAKIINGYEDGSFKANAQITREELATMVVRALTFAGVKSDLSVTQQATLLGKFTDAGQIVWAKKEIAAAIDAGIINGLTNTTIGSSKQATRAEAATMLKRFLTKADFIN